jgi:hypothetical protein
MKMRITQRGCPLHDAQWFIKGVGGKYDKEDVQRRVTS